ncbi:MAG: hypothetical protein FJ026_13785 [Chloroflexi bacterium]|nr:hypothetical protein [Chloroflexota bacterium]
MQLGTHLLSLLLVVGLLMANASACDLWKTPTLAPTPPPDIPAEVLGAHSAVLAYLRQTYGGKMPPEGIAWTARNTTWPGTTGVSSYEFSSGNWLMTVRVPIVSPGVVLYEMQLDNHDTGVHWAGSLSADYRVLESNLDVVVEVLIVRDIVLGHYRRSYPSQAPAENVVWAGERITPEGSVGRERCQFTSGEWTMIVDYELARPDQVVYEVQLQNPSGPVLWRCNVNAQGEVLEIQAKG